MELICVVMHVMTANKVYGYAWNYCATVSKTMRCIN